MIENDKASDPLCLDKLRARRLRIAGVLIFLLGMVSAGTVYWLGTRRAEDLSNDAAMVGNERAARREVIIMYGQYGQIVEDLSNDLKEPGTQAIIIGLISATISVGCFYFARLFEGANDGDLTASRQSE